MNSPFISYIISISIWISLIVVVGTFSLKRVKMDDPQIAIEAEMFGEIIEKKSTPKLVRKEIRKLYDDKISDLKKSKNQKEIEHHDHHYEDQKNIKSQNHKILYRPLPQIPRNLRKEAFATKAIAKFYVNKDGVVKKMKLLKASSNPRLNFLLMKELKKWRFEKTGADFEVEVHVKFQVK